MSKAVIILSGGLDSSVLLGSVVSQYGAENTYPITFNYGQRHVEERFYAFEQSHHFKIPHSNHQLLDLSFFQQVAAGSALTDHSIKVPHIRDVVGDPQPVTYVPNRNMMFLSIAAAFAEGVKATEVFYGAQQADTFSGYWDAAPEFLEAINNVLNLNRRNKITIQAPFMNMDKSEIIQLGTKLGVDFAKTLTCYEGSTPACGTCPACSNRIKAFLDAGAVDPLSYAIKLPWNS
jgi:7-cyano-7-deazaguanine synthase